MSVEIPFVSNLSFEYGTVAQVSPGIRRVIARNPSPFTFYGTGTYIVGQGRVAVIDPGPLDTDHVRALVEATRGEEISHILVTHTHMDHSPACRLLRAHCDASTYGFGPHGSGHADDGVVVEEGGDMEFVPDCFVADGDVVEGDGWAIRCLFTPGHTSNHVCYAYLQENALFSGDHVMGWSTSVVSPPDGDMEHYMASLRRLQTEPFETYWPTHGPPIVNPLPHLEAFIAHRLEREGQIQDLLARGMTKIAAMVPRMYANVDKRLHPAAARSVFAALTYMVKRGDVTVDGSLSEDSTFGVAKR